MITVKHKRTLIIGRLLPRVIAVVVALPALYAAMSISESPIFRTVKAAEAHR